MVRSCLTVSGARLAASHCPLWTAGWEPNWPPSRRSGHGRAHPVNRGGAGRTGAGPSPRSPPGDLVGGGAHHPGGRTRPAGVVADEGHGTGAPMEGDDNCRWRRPAAGRRTRFHPGCFGTMSTCLPIDRVEHHGRTGIRRAGDDTRSHPARRPLMVFRPDLGSSARSAAPPAGGPTGSAAVRCTRRPRTNSVSRASKR